MKSLERALCAALVAATVVAAPWAASGAPETVRLEYRVDEQSGCVGKDELRRMVIEQLRFDPFDPYGQQRMAISIVRTAAGFQGRIVWTEADGRLVGERVLSSRGRDCDEIAANLAFAVALQLQLVERRTSQDAGAAVPNAEQPNPKASDENDHAPTTPKASDDSNRAVITPERTSQSPAFPVVPDRVVPSRLRLMVGAGPVVALGMTPDASAFGRLFVAARFHRWSAEIAADAALPATQRERDGTGVAVNALGSTAAGCAHVAVASVCMLGRLGWIRAEGVGVTAPSVSWGRFAEVGMRLAGTTEFGRLSVSIHADGLVMLARWNVVLNDAVVWSVPRVGGGVGVDLALRFF